MSSSEKTTPKLEFEIWIKIACPNCSETKKRLFISLPVRGLPNEISCFNCGKSFNIRDILSKGKELLCRMPKDEVIKGVIK